MRNDFPQITKGKGCQFRIPDSRFLTFHKRYKNMADSNYSYYNGLRSPPSPLLLSVRTIATWKTVIGSMQSLGMDNFRVAYIRFLAFYSDTIQYLKD